ncbi:MAG: biliverdin-producing heme oxygenase, partial [Cyanobacteriota bacterium]
LSGGQLLAPHANAILQRKGLPALSFWVFEHPEKLKQALHDTFERFVLSTTQEAELIDEAEEAFRATQGLLADLEAVRLEEPGAADKDPNDPGRSH